jgi:hypothetical protein
MLGQGGVSAPFSSLHSFVTILPIFALFVKNIYSIVRGE